MKRLASMVIFLAGIASLPAQQNGIDQDLEFIANPFSDGKNFIRWYGHVGRSYFVQVSDPANHLKTWHFSTMIEGGDDDYTSHEVIGTAEKGFFRLKYTDQVPGPNEDLNTADFDNDGISNRDEVEPPEGISQTDPLNPDTDGDGMPDGWERANGLDPNDATGINGADGDPDGDGLSNYDEWWNYVDPNNSDTDGDGLSDGDEVHLYDSCPWCDDSDWDGINDYDEVMVYGTDPSNWDTDGDSLSDGDKIYIHFTNPLEMDTDGDWMWDDYELDNSLDPNDSADGLLDADGDTLANQLEFVFMDENYDPFTYDDPAAFPWASDPDWDGLTTQVEFVVYLTNPKQPDTDGDGFNDGWELAHGFNPQLDNLVAGPANHHPDADPDGDGLTNAEEEQLGTNPNSIDTDGDGVNDNIENDQGSNPNDPSDSQPPPNGTVPVNFTFGDHSESHSEKYRVQLTPWEGDTYGLRYRTNRHYGQTQEGTFRLPKGAKYKVELIHIGTNPRYRDQPRPDYDYTLEIDDSANCLAVEDPEGIMGVNWDSYSFFAEGKDATLYVPLFEWVTPKESPVTAPDDAADGQNEFTYDAASPGVLTIDLKVLVKPTGTAAVTDRHGVKFSDRCVYALPAIAGSTFAWDAANPDGKSATSGEYLIAKATYTTLPALNTELGLKQAEFECDGHADTLPKGDFEVFYMAQEKNHPGGDPTHPNWFHYYKQNSGGGSYTYDPTPGARSSSVSNGGESTIKIGDYVHSPSGEYITTTITAGLLKATGWSSTNKYYAHFVGVLAHERQHALGEVTQGGPDDPDSDWLSTVLETNYSQTDPNDPVSASSGVSAVAGFTDDEVYAGGPVEEAGVTGADTSQDWANPGTNHK